MVELLYKMGTWETTIEAGRQTKTDDNKDPKAQEDPRRDMGEQQKLILDAQKILGDYLLTKFSNSMNVYPNLAQFIYKFAPYFLNFTYTVESKNYNTGLVIKPEYLQCGWASPGPDVVRTILNGETGKDLTALVLQSKDANAKPSYQITGLFPEKKAVDLGIIPGQHLYNNPLDIVMMMVPENRSLIAIATSKLVKKMNRTLGPPTGFITDLTTLVEVMKEYNISDINPGPIEELNRITRNLPR